MTPKSERAAFPWSAVAGRAGCCVLLLAAILVPFFLFGDGLEAAARKLIESRPSDWQLALVLGGLLAMDIALPVPSSLVSTTAGGMLGFWAGTATSWTGMMVGGWLGYQLGAGTGRAALRRLAGEPELERIARAAERLGPGFLLVFRAVPVLAEASVVFAGTGRMRPRAFLTVTALANLGVSATYAAVGASAARLESFLLLFAGVILIPGVALGLMRFLHRRPAKAK